MNWCLGLNLFFLIAIIIHTGYSLVCYECFFSNINESTETILKNCTKQRSCSTGSACILNQNIRQRRFSSYCLYSGIKLNQKPTENVTENAEGVNSGCWKLPQDADEEFCYCTADYCNEIDMLLKKDDKNLKFLKSNPFLSEDNEIDEENEKDLLQEALDDNSTSQEKLDTIDVIPAKFEDYQNFVKDRSDPNNKYNVIDPQVDARHRDNVNNNNTNGGVVFGSTGLTMMAFTIGLWLSVLFSTMYQ